VRALVAPGGLEPWMLGELEALAADPAFCPGEAFGNPTTLLAVAQGHLFVQGAARPGGGLTGHAGHVVVGVLAGRPTLAHYRHDGPARDPVVLDRDAPLLRVDERPMHTGDALVFEAWRDVIAISGPGLLLQLDTAPHAAVRWDYDVATLRPARLIAAGDEVCQVMDALDMLACVEHPDDFDACAALTAHPAHFVRWQALRAAAAIEPRRARALLDALREDRHADVRHAAAAALSAG
jgi:hypothetical protein